MLLSVILWCRDYDCPLVSSNSSYNYQLIGQRSTCYSEFQWTWILDLVFGKKSLKISKMFTKAVNGRIDNTMTNKKRTNNNLQSNTQKTKDWATGTPLKLGMNTRIRISKKDELLHNYKTTNNNLPNIISKINDQTTRTPLKPKVNSGVPEELAVPFLLVELVVLLLLQTRRYFMNE